jgi:hypothetical protein
VYRDGDRVNNANRDFAAVALRRHLCRLMQGTRPSLRDYSIEQHERYDMTEGSVYDPHTRPWGMSFSSDFPPANLLTLPFCAISVVPGYLCPLPTDFKTQNPLKWAYVSYPHTCARNESWSVKSAVPSARSRSALSRSFSLILLVPAFANAGHAHYDIGLD